MIAPARKRAMRRAATAAAAAGITWGITGLSGRHLARAPLGLLAIAALGNLAVQAGNTSKTKRVEQRLNSHIAATAPAVNFVANGGIVGGNVTGPGGGTLGVSAALHSSASIQADTWVYCTDLSVGGQRIAPGQGIPAFYPQGGVPDNAHLAADVNQIVNGLIAAGIFA